MRRVLVGLGLIIVGMVVGYLRTDLFHGSNLVGSGIMLALALVLAGAGALTIFGAYVVLDERLRQAEQKQRRW